MKKAALSILAALLTLSACAKPTAPAQAASPGPGKPVIALVVKTLTNPFFVAMEQGARKAEAEMGFTLVVKSAAQETSID